MYELTHVGLMLDIHVMASDELSLLLTRPARALDNLPKCTQIRDPHLFFQVRIHDLGKAELGMH